MRRLRESAPSPGAGTAAVFLVACIALAALATVFPSPAAASAFSPVVNAGFEDPSMAGWGWYNRATAAFRSDTERPHSGERCVLFTNQSPLAPEVYGRLNQGVPVLPATEYELSVWVRGRNVKPAIHMTDWDRYTLNFPDGTFDWRRVSLRFRTGDGQSTLNLGFNIVNQCEALWVDDVQLRPVGIPVEAKGLTASMYVPGQVEGDKVDAPFCVSIESNSRPGLTLTATVRAGEKSLFTKSVPVPTEPTAFEWSWNSGTTTERWIACRVNVVDADGQFVASASRMVEKIGPGMAKDVDRIDEQGAQLRRLIDQCRTRGIPVDYPMTALALLDQFAPLTREDIRRKEYRRAGFAIRDLARALDAAIEETDACLRDSSLAPVARRYRTPGEVSESPLDIEGMNFIGDRVDSKNGISRGPVFFCGYGHFMQVRKDIPRFPDYGVNIIQIEIGPSDVLTTEGVVSLDKARAVVDVLDNAAAHNVAVNVLLSPHYFPRWALAKWPHLGKGGGGFLPFCIDDPEAKQVVEEYLRAVIPLFRGKPALHSLCLSNEPLFDRGAGCDGTRPQWEAWLAATHGDVATMNDAYGTTYTTFAQVPIPGNDSYDAPPFYDYCLFNQSRFAGWHRWMAAIIHTMAPEIPVHAKMMPITLGWRHSIAWGLDPERFAAFSDINGNDCWTPPVPVRDENGWAIGWHLHNMLYDLQRSLAAQPIFNSENHPTVDRSTYYVPPEHFRATLWQGAIHGEGATTIWVWEHAFDRGSDFYGNVMDRPGCAREVGTTCLDLNRFADEVAALQRQRAPVALVFSMASLVRDGGATAALTRVYEALNFLGVKVDFISEKQLAAGKGADYELIVFAGATHSTAETLKAVADLAANAKTDAGGKGNTGAGICVALFGDCLRKDPYGRDFDESLRAAAVNDALLIDAATTDTRAMAQLFRKALSTRGGLSEFQVVDAATGKPAWGVEWLPATLDDGRAVINLVNLLGKPMEIRIEKDSRPVEAFDLLPRPAPKTPVTTLEPLVPVLATIKRTATGASQSTAPSGFWKSGGSRNCGSQSAVAEWAKFRGRPCDFQTVYSTRDNGWKAFVSTHGSAGQIAAFTDPSIEILIQTAPFPDKIGCTYSALVAGSYDDYWRRIGAEIKRREDSGRPTIVSIAWEMNGSYMYWGGGGVGSRYTSPSQYIAGYRRIVEQLRTAHPRIRTAWIINAHATPASCEPNQDAWGLYPGDEYVTYVGIDNYDMYPRSLTKSDFDRAANANGGLNWLADRAARSGKQIIVGEWGLNANPSEVAKGVAGGDNADYIQWMWETFQSWRASDRLYAEYYFVDRLGGGDVDSDLIGGNPKAGRRYAELWREQIRDASTMPRHAITASHGKRTLP